ncbi:type II secretion system protein [Fictibacillus terranigra]|uniref:Type II secretion system protein n=1 Tax=Fictibacillus terranigra TaxID=3058424 RepID=A0ABT8E9Y3_9BACL|nr:type II secretion system protein [Fictibacillus sp. CENA-BCM004]MDN4074731.1 type II secretion system protein [Fictibacillus sp. CENA-BCM004]
MLKNSRGYFLLEALLALSVFSIVISGIGLALHALYTERFTIKQEREALQLLSNKMTIEAWGGDEGGSSYIRGQTAEFQWRMLEGGLCIEFTGKNGRTYRECDVRKQ